MAASRESLYALCSFLLGLPFCTSQSSQVQELADVSRQDLRASNGRHLLQTSTVYPVFLGDADGGVTLGSFTLSSASQVVGSTTTTWTYKLYPDYSYAFAPSLAQTGCGVMQVTGTGSSATSYAAFLNLTYLAPPKEYRTRDTNSRVLSNRLSNYFVGPAVGVGRPAGLAKFSYPYSITPIIENNDTVSQTFNVSATFRPVGKACSSATFANDGQQASPVILWSIGEDVLNKRTGGDLVSVLLANATCISIKLEVQNAPTTDQLNATVNLNITSYAKPGTGLVSNQPLISLQQPFAASSATSSYSGALNNLDPGTIYTVRTSGQSSLHFEINEDCTSFCIIAALEVFFTIWLCRSGPTQNAVMVSVRVAMLTQKGANCGTQLTADLSLAQPPSTGK